MRLFCFVLALIMLGASQAQAGKVKGKYLRKGDVVCRSGRDVGSYYYHKYHQHTGNVEQLFKVGICVVIDSTKSIIAIADKTEEELYERSIKVMFWDKGRKLVGYTNVKNIR